MPLTVASGVEHAARCASREALGRPILPEPMRRSPRSRWCAMMERFLARRRARRACRAPEAAVQMDAPQRRGHARPLDFSDGAQHDRRERRRGGGAWACARLTCVDHVRARHRLGARRTSRPSASCARRRASTCCAASRRSSSTPAGDLDLPAGAADGVDAIYAADHQVPLADGPHHPREVRERARRPATLGAARRARGDRRRHRGGRRAATTTSSSPTCSASCRRSASTRPTSRSTCSTRSPRPRRAAGAGSRSTSAGAAPRRGRSRRSSRRGVRAAAQHRQPPPRDDRPLRVLRGALRRARSGRWRARQRCDALEWVLVGLVARRGDPAARRLLPVRARRPAPASGAGAGGREPAARAWRSSSRPGTRRR